MSRMKGKNVLRNMRVSASILGADFSQLGVQVKQIVAAGADMIHIDIMDGHFVPNLTMGPDLIKSLRGKTDVPFDLHLMVTPIDNYLDIFCDLGIQRLAFHAETAHDIVSVIDKIRQKKIKVGLALNPDQSLDHIMPYLSKIDFVLIMTVFPGFAGAKFIPEVIPKISALRGYILAQNITLDIEVDGGINAETGPDVIKAGADILVSASYLFSGGPKAFVQNINRLKQI